ncbi:hypothetical protein [Caldisericum exile]|uniref:Molybdopterin-guanine dinucleotide biosynthesis protein B (MobB) domain-containing protein n=1 Tax=Caldisericum exile (strain DSM 21853 / NBRC 104410 / AZM16c01) TaxID=511051 RepID=A0A7U6GFK6_CALEA|nr:hypothetical protein [Caldisericum exile]BAL81401.1 hypothetical protein CSE_12750 [Caldisericum exile AZM16c01]
MQKIVLIGGSKSNVGKTTLSRIILKLFPKIFIALKITNNLLHGFGITEETYKTAPFGKDTYFLFENAKKVFWAKGDFDYLNEHLRDFVKSIEGPLLVEGNIFYTITKPDLFIFVEKENEPIKEDAKKLLLVSDFIIVNGDFQFKVEGNSVFVNLQRNLESIEEEFKEFLKNLILPLLS